MRLHEILEGKVLKSDIKAFDVDLKNGKRFQIIETETGLQIIRVNNRHENLGMEIAGSYAINIK